MITDLEDRPHQALLPLMGEKPTVKLEVEILTIDETGAAVALGLHIASEMVDIVRGRRVQDAEKRRRRSCRSLDEIPEISRTSRSFLWTN